ncbi:TPA: fibronectin-binding protein SfbI [Streptococcus pyogenes]|uniref:fibronectin-binding protein PrtF1/SfbI n=1 Tax=Streptococcus pyogenes TaxID=1314 RepID=UPI0006A658D8|nr:fibronectin-binding protein PrtF1/SfbI [Streptococcus pyogenes]HER4571623.1 fibronectin-binding protein SfbI [Streptococcus pyogenes NGAS641]HER4601076.1 fibronectin-binding protein SfbI [Streptococcus pyogenes NGAS625]HER4629081.1 fibronectin-binding protein SfbI [Streptococcus pyogenes NGAS599]HER4700196.1 fibronectin-binding protein SfbI [Streptococcus pyogenes NGAS322]HEP1232900.1 fibronectin-binding protein SfbI [Streptococcus pyogenes]
MNNKMFLNKEAGFLAHTKRKRRFAVTLVGVFFMLLACAGAIGFGQVAYAADEKTVPNRINSNPEFPWYGYDSYSGRLLRYHNLKVNLNGSKEYQAYCFNLKRFEPKKEESSSPNWYKKLDGSTETFKKYAENPRFSGEELRRHILKVLYNGYPNSNEIMKGIDPLNAILVTQNAIWYYSDSAPINDINNFFTSEANDLNIPPQQLTLMREALRKLISSDENLVKQVPSNFKLSTFESSDKSYQNLLSAEYVPDDPPKPGDTSEHNPKTPELDGTPIPEDPKRPDESSEPALPPLMPELDGEEVPEKPSVDLPIEVPRYEFNNKDQSPLAGESGETEYITEVYGNQQNPVDIDKKLPNETGFSGNMVETEDTKEPEVLMGGQSESVEFTKDTQTGMSGFSETVTIVEDTRPKLVFHFDNNEPKVEENREKPTKNITPILPATGDIGNVLAFLGILILSVLSIFSLLKNKQNNKV